MSNQLTLIIVQSLLQYGPALARELLALFSKPTPSQADWDKVFSLAEKNYDEYIKEPTKETT